MTNWYRISQSALKTKLESLRYDMATKAQEIYDDWEQDSEGVSFEYGAGGICDEINRAISDIISSNLEIDHLTEGGQDGDDHSWSIVSFGEETYGVDIPHQIYESGGGYRWSKIPDVVFSPEMIEIFPMDLPEDYEW